MELPKHFDLFDDGDKELWLKAKEGLDEAEKEFKFTSTEDPDFDTFSITSSYYETAIPINSWKTDFSVYSFNLCLVKLGSEMYFLGHLRLKTDFGVAYIRPETWADKINELFDSVEIDFKSHPVFSKRYFVVAKNRSYFKHILPNSLLNFMQDIEDLQLEFRNQQCLFRLTRPAIYAEECVQLCKIGVNLDKILNH